MALDSTLNYFDVSLVVGKYLVPGSPNNLSAGNLSNYFDTGAGRFVNGAQFELVEKFYTESIPAGTYTMQQMKDLLGVGNTVNIYQTDWKDNFDDYSERALIFNSMSYRIDDDASFEVLSTGERIIHDYRIELAAPENFDFEGAGYAKDILNKYLEQMIDPYSEGARVDFEFADDIVARTYTDTDFINDSDLKDSWDQINILDPLDHLALWNGIHDLVEELRENEVISPSLNDLFQRYSGASGVFASILAETLITDLAPGALEIAAIIARANVATGPRDPLAIDLDGDGIEFINQADSDAFFDLDGDSFAERTGWISGDDGFLVQDSNTNGLVDDIDEMFGNDSVSGLQELAILDGNSDGIIDASDTGFSSLRVWRDADEDGVTDAGELQSLSYYNITELRYDGLYDGRNIEGTFINNVASVTLNGQPHDLAELFFDSSDFDTQYIGDGGIDALIDPLTLLLPLSRGYGDIPSLQIAMTNDAVLRGMVEDLVVLEPEDYTAAHGQIEDILLQWANPGSLPNITNYSPERLAILEKFSGEPFTNISGTLVTGVAIPLLDEAWDALKTEMTFRLLVQGPMAEIFPDAAYDFSTDSVSLNTDLETLMDAVALSALGDNIYFLHDLRNILLPRADEVDATRSEILSAIADQMLVAVGSPDDDTYGLAGKIAAMDIDRTYEAGDPTSIYYTSNIATSDLLSDMVLGKDDNTAYDLGDWIELGLGGSYVIAGGGNDQIFQNNAQSNDDIILAGEGNDYISYYSVGGTGKGYLSGGAGNDRFGVYGNEHTLVGGDGNDSFESVNGNDLVIGGGAGNDTLFGGNSNYTGRLIDMGAGADYLFGRFGGDVITMGDGDDNASIGGIGSSHILSESLLDGGDGNDTLWTHLLSNSTMLGGDGNDTITSSYNTSGSFLFGGGEGNDSITVMNTNYSPSSTRIVQGNEGNDTILADSSVTGVSIEGGDGADTIELGWQVAFSTVVGGEGDDTIINGYGDWNEFQFSEGDGHDVITQSPTNTESTLGAYDTIVIDGETLTGAADYISGGTWELTVGTETFDLTMDGSSLVITRSGISGDSITIEQFDPNLGGYGFTLDSSSQILTGTSGADTLTGGYGQDTITGLGDDDSLVGGFGSDSIDGGADDDTIVGGGHADTLIGGAGNDVFKYLALSDSGIGSGNRDVITDFAIGDDLIDLSALNISTVTFLGTDPFVGGYTTPLLRFSHSGGNTLVELDIDYDTAPDLQISLVGTHTLTLSDFVV